MSFTARVAAPAVVLAALGAPAFAQPAPQFTITEGPITGGTTNNTVRADRIEGSYAEDFFVTGGTATSGTFSTNALFTATGYSLNGSAVAPVRLNTEEPLGYKLYATFTAAGNFTAPVGGDRSFVGTTGTLNVFLDPNSNTTTEGAVTPGGTTSDDLRLGSSTLLGINGGSIRAGANNGDFRLTFDSFSLTDNGARFFTSPNPFYTVVTIRGNFNTFPIPAIGASTRVTGSANAAFELVPARVPEPGSLALMAIAVLGAAVTLRRRKA